MILEEQDHEHCQAPSYLCCLLVTIQDHEHRQAPSSLCCLLVIIHATLMNITYTLGGKCFGVKLKLLYFDNCEFYEEFISLISLLPTAFLGDGPAWISLLPTAF
jgi:hypothetical protein